MEKNQKDFYDLVFNRDFCLANIEVWCRGESTEERQWTDKQQPVKPYIIFERKNNSVNCYMCRKGIDWIKDELLKLISKDKNYVRKAIKVFNDKNKKIEQILSKNNTLNHEELVSLIYEHMDGWPWFEATWWLMEMYGETGKESEEYKLLEKARTETENFAIEFEDIIIKSLKNIFPEICDYVDALTIEEIETKNIPSINILKNRQNNYIYTNAMLYENESIEYMEKFYNIQIEKEKVIENELHSFKGFSAYPGKIVGYVKKVIGKPNSIIIKNNEILVTPMTTPDFVPIIKDALAIVTDEGGVTCHAAIVAREMKKPTIIGTKIATSILRDGDLVEVDAERGIVKILKKAV